jgi:hypothetical protein
MGAEGMPPRHQDGKALTLLSGTVIPGVSLFFALVFFPALLGLGRLRGRI